MLIPTVPVTIKLAGQGGAAISEATITAILNRDEVYAGFVIPQQSSVITNSVGFAVIDLWPNLLGTQGSQYVFRITTLDGKSLSITATVPNAACNLVDIANMPSYAGKPDGQLAIDGAIAAMAAADADVLLTHADAAATAGDVVATHADAAATAGDVVATHADVLLTHADAAATAADVLLTNADAAATAADAITAATEAAAAALSAQHALVPSQAISADYTVLATDMGSVLMCTGPMILSFPAASAIGSFAVPIMIGNINIPNVTVAGLPALLDHMEFGQFEAFLSDGSSWRRMVGDSNSRVGKLRATVNASPWTAVLTSDSLTPVALNQITPPFNTAFSFAGRVVAKAVATTTQNQKSALWKIEGSGYIDATAGSLVLFAVTITNPTSNTVWSVAVSADLTNGSIQISFTGDQAVRLIAEIGLVMLP